MGLRRSVWVMALFAAVVATGCSVFQKQPSLSTPLIHVAPGDAGYPSFSDDLDYEGLEDAVAKSLLYYSRLPKDRSFRFGEKRVTTGTMVQTAMRFLYLIQHHPKPDDLADIVRENFDVYMSRGQKGAGDVLFTGYYEAQLFGSRTRSDRYRYPVLGRPENLVTINLKNFPGVKVSGKSRLVGRVNARGEMVPYYPRKEVGGAEAEKILPFTEALVWVDDPVDLFFLEIQGSGVVDLEEGGEMRVQYRGKNGQPYRSIGGYLIRQGELTREEVSMQSIRAWLKANPQRQQEVFNHNPSLVFFREATTDPLGCYGIPVTPMRSIATDKSLFPACGLAFIQTEKPDAKDTPTINGWESFGRFVTNQDTGGAIKGPGRVDLFTGHGKKAERVAGHMKQPGTLYFLLRKPK